MHFTEGERMNTPAINAALLDLAAALPIGVGIAVIVVRGADDKGHRQCHVCDQNMDAGAFALAGDCLKQLGESDGETPAGVRIN